MSKLMYRRKRPLPFDERIIPKKQGDKENWKDSWSDTGDYEERSLLNFLKGSKIGVIARAGGGKSSLIANMILRAHPSFKKLVIIHPDHEITQDYDEFFNDEPDDESVVLRGDIPTVAEWNEYVKEVEEKDGSPGPIACILDDIEYDTMSKPQRKSLDHLMRYISSHKNVTVYVTAQYFHILPLIIRRNLNVLFLAPCIDKAEESIVAKKVGLKATTLKRMFEIECREFFDNICIDLSEKTPAKYRKNGFEVLNIHDYENKKLKQIKHVPNWEIRADEDI